MRKYLIILVCLVVTTSIAQNRYSIYSISGDIFYKSQNGEKWVKAKKRMPLRLGDLLKISQNGIVSILDSYTYNVYYSKQSGSCYVKNILKKALNDKSALMKRLGEEIIINTTSTNPNRISFRPIGGVKMGGSSIEDSIASCLYSYMNSEMKTSSVVVNDQLSFRKLYASKDFLTFEISNNSPKDYFFNIARIDRKRKKIFICYNISDINEDEGSELSLFISSDDTISFSDFPFAASKKEEFVVFGVDKEFSVEVLQSILDKGYNDGNTSKLTSISNFCVGVDKTK